jgi:hypothetical protein
MTKQLEPISPAEAKEMYLNARKHEVSQSTLNGYHYRLKHFIRWCENVEGLDNMNDLTGRNYDKRSEQVKMEQRRAYLEDV